MLPVEDLVSLGMILSVLWRLWLQFHDEWRGLYCSVLISESDNASSKLHNTKNIAQDPTGRQHCGPRLAPNYTSHRRHSFPSLVHVAMAVNGHRHSTSVSQAQNHKAQLANAYNELGKELSSQKIRVVGNYTLGKVIGEGASLVDIAFWTRTNPVYRDVR